MNQSVQTTYFEELAQRIQREHIESVPPDGDRLPILLNGQEIGVITPGGAIRVRAESIRDRDASDLYHRAGAIAAEVREYMELMNTAPFIKASSLSAPYTLFLSFTDCLPTVYRLKTD